MTPFLPQSRTSLSKRFQELFRPARAAQMYLIDAKAQCEVARQAGAPLFASQLFQETSILLHCASDEFQHHRFAEARVLALLALKRASDALTVAEMARLHFREDLQHQMQCVLITLGDIKKMQFRSDTCSLECADKCKEQIHKALTDLLSAFTSLHDNDFSTARAHLGYASAMTERLKSYLQVQSSFEANVNRRRRSASESFDRWFIKHANEIEQMDQSPRLFDAHDSAKVKVNSIWAHGEIQS